MNLLNYIDRYSFFAVGTQIKRDLTIDDKWFGVLGGSFMIVYTLMSPLMGWLGDRYNRRMLLAGGVGLWSLATVGTAFSTDFYHMFFWRALLGVGEASYGVIAPALLADLFAVEKRGRAMGIYYLALPIGTALGFIIAGRVCLDWGWPAVFFVVGLPGLARGRRRAGSSSTRARCLRRQEVRRQGRAAQAPRLCRALQDAHLRLQHARDGRGHVRHRSLRRLGQDLLSAGPGDVAEGRQRLHRRPARHRRPGRHRAIHLPRRPAAEVHAAGLSALASVVVIASVPLGIAGILDPERTSSLSLLFAASVLMAMVLGPSNTVTANVVPANRRAAGYALFIFLIHLLGDISSPILLGWISDLFGSTAVVSSALGKLLLSIGAGPTADESGQLTNLTVAMLAVGPVLLLGGILFLIGSRHLPGDMDRIASNKDQAADDPDSLH